MAARFRRLRVTLAVLALVVLAAAGGLLWLAQSPAALRFAANRIESALGGRLALHGLSGSLARRFLVERAVFAQGGLRIEIADLEIEWSLRALLSRAVEISSLQAGRVDVRVVPSGEEIELPASLALPVDIRADSVAVGAVEVRVGEAAPLEFRDVSLAYRGGRARHEIGALRVRSPWGPMAGALRVGANAGFPVAGDLAWTLADLPVDGALDTQVAGTLDRIELPATGTLLGHAVSGSARLRLFEDEKIESLQARWEAVDLAALFEGAPASAIDVDAVLEPASDTLLAGRFALANAAPGALSQDRVPLVAARGRFRVADRALHLTALEADLGSAGSARGDVRIAGDGAVLGLDVARLDLDGLHGKLARTALDGRIDARIAGQDQHATATLAQPGLRLALDASRKGAEVEVTRLAVDHRGGRLDGRGRIGLEGPQAFAADLRFRGLDPSAFADLPGARLSGSARLDGNLAPDWRLRGRFELRDSRLRGHAISGSGSVTADARRVATEGTVLRVGDNDLRLDGAFGGARDRLSYRLDGRQLSDLDPRLDGRLEAHGTVTGRVAQPVVELVFSGEALAFADYRAHAIAGEGTLRYGRDPGLRLAVSGGRLVLPALGELVAARLELDGVQSRHAAKFAATGQVVDASMELRGGFSRGRWSGEVTSFENRGRYPMRLAAPVPIRVAAREFRLGAAEIAGPVGKARIERIEFGEGRLETAGEFTGAPLAVALAFAGIDPGETSLRMRGAWRLATTPRVNGTFHLERESGGVTFGDAPPYTLRLAELAVTGEIVEDRLTLSGRAIDEELGEAVVTATALPVPGARAPALGRDSALDARVELVIPTLRALDRIVGANASISGSARSSLVVAGTIGEPVVTGTLDAERVRIAAPQHGLFLTDGRIRAALRGRELRIEELSVAGGSGHFSATGQVALGGAEADSKVEWRAEDFRLFNSPARRLVLDGAGTLATDGRALLARGDLRASQAHFLLNQPQGPRLADDVVVVGRAPPRRPRRLPLPLDLDLAFDFGDRFHVEERGLDALLSGRLRVRTDAAGRPSAEGVVNVDRGTYLAYGQMMFIDDGRLYFNGPPTDPGLEITAMRRNLPVQVGIRLTGTAMTPVVQLISEPPMPDNEKLSWLILGRSAGNTSTADAATLAAAAEALMAGPSGVPVTTRLARQVGLDEIGLRSRGDEGEAVALGRRLSDRVYLFLERGISAATTALIIEYALTRELRLRAEAGDINGLGISWGRTLQ
jgi:translocation and assembly module TamB